MNSQGLAFNNAVLFRFKSSLLGTFNISVMFLFANVSFIIILKLFLKLSGFFVKNWGNYNFIQRPKFL